MAESTEQQQRWEKMRLYWLYRGETLSAESPMPPDEDCRLMMHAVDVKRSMLRQRSKSGIKVRTASILGALREQHRLVEFNRRLPLKNLVDIVEALFAEEAINNAGHVRDASIAPRVLR